MKIIIALVAACLLSACAPRSPVVGAAGCDVWNETKGTVTGRAVEAEYAAGFFDAYSIAHPTQPAKYGWIIDSINLECEHEPSLKIYEAAERVVERFAK